jgi:DNA-binding MarR family transcriptional regulator
MNYNEIFSVFLVDLQSFFRQKISYPGASYQQLIAILVIPDDGIEMNNLASKIGIKISTLTRLVNGLRSKKWVIKKQSTDDRRVVNVFLSEEGLEVQNYLVKRTNKLGGLVEENIVIANSQELIENLSTLHWAVLKSKNKNIE